jgi:hypothetical protein
LAGYTIVTRESEFSEGTGWEMSLHAQSLAGSTIDTHESSFRKRHVVMVDGGLIKRGGKLIGFDVEEIVARAKVSSLKIRTAAGGILGPVCPGCGNPVFHAQPC